MKLLDMTEKEWPAVRAIYLEAFPREERMPLWAMRRQWRRGNMELAVLMSDDGVCGMTAVTRTGDLVLVAYLAVKSDRRGCGCGSELLRLLTERYTGDRIVLEIERPDTKAASNRQRLRRKAFYLRGGFVETGLFSSMYRLPMELLCYGGSVSFEEYRAAYEKLIGRLLARRHIRPLTERTT